MKARVLIQRITAVLVFAVSLFWFGCSEDSRVTAPDQASEQIPSIAGDVTPQVAAAPVATNWHSLTDTQRNSYILQWAQEKVGTSGDTCKVFAYNMVKYASNNVLLLPSNFISAGDPYNKAKWYDNQYCIAAWQGAYYCPSGFPTNVLKPGQIIQMRFIGYNNGNDGTGLHTAIIKSVTSTEMMWIDSNWSLNNMVQEHKFTLANWSSKIEAWTVYQVK